ncbi:Lipid A export ATP-binding/permease protein MsbA [Pseudodesulfovibrio hydrargyri]|uniref:Lipid A export ATP-binding/permease protein MsbA n=1 Tax=Pseudodesulfovibrio hydrargyri TaxID=2125990 RepID=A0A1J5MZ78_9BACT|nr:ABC transporter ATP-binding protein [Pseudodesulfovibrio hydrargyri]OIQ51829.1 Lipid A export ATP-binding/permease protein MsbA [Pseudodesulfovibrio hydrargyri]
MARKPDLHTFSNRYLLKRSIGYFGAYKGRVALAVASMLLLSPISPALAWIGKYVMDDVLIAKDMGMLKLCILAFLGLWLLRGLLMIGQAYTMQATGMLVLRDIRNELFKKIIRLPMPYFAESEVGMLMSRIIADVTAVRACLPSVLMFVRQIFTLIALIGTTIYLDPYLSLWALLVMPAAIYPFTYFGKKIRKYGRKTQAELSGVNVVLEESFSGIKVIKAFANEVREDFKFKKENDSLTRLLVRKILYNEGSSRAMDIVGACAGASVLWFGGMRVINGDMTPGDLMAFSLCVLQLYEPIKKLNTANNEIQGGLAGAERVFDILDSPSIQVEEEGKTVFDGSLRSLVFRSVRFTYPGCPAPAVDGVDLTIEAGQRVAIVGPSGSGKTTLVNLIPRFYLAQEGVVELNGVPLEDYTLESLRTHLGLVSQDTFLFNVSIADNIAYAHDGYEMSDVRRAADAAFAHEFITVMPEGYDTVVGEGGVKISGGQKQRLTIARAIMKNPSLLILDEATSALDTESERVVQKALDNLMQGRTSIVIAHRLSTILTADVIVVMKDGRIVARGKHDELLATCPLYDRLYQMQFEDTTETSRADAACTAPRLV